MYVVVSIEDTRAEALHWAFRAVFWFSPTAPSDLHRWGLPMALLQHSSPHFHLYQLKGGWHHPRSTSNAAASVHSNPENQHLQHLSPSGKKKKNQRKSQIPFTMGSMFITSLLSNKSQRSIVLFYSGEVPKSQFSVLQLQDRQKTRRTPVSPIQQWKVFAILQCIMWRSKALQECFWLLTSTETEWTRQKKELRKTGAWKTVVLQPRS